VSGPSYQQQLYPQYHYQQQPELYLSTATWNVNVDRKTFLTFFFVTWFAKKLFPSMVKNNRRKWF
jgi:hypothetical protein